MSRVRRAQGSRPRRAVLAPRSFPARTGLFQPGSRDAALVACWSLALSLLLLGPLLGAGWWLWADAVSVPRSYLVDQAFGLAEAAPRATPQDAALAVLSSAVDGGLAVKAITVLALFAAGTGAARLVRAFLLAPQRGLGPGTGHRGIAAQLVAASFAIDNLWVAERLLQGQWSLLVGYGALGHVAVLAARLRGRSAARDWAELGFWLAAGGIVPTGAVFVLLLAGLVLALPGGSGWRSRIAGLAGLWLLASAPWTAAGLFGLSRQELGAGGAAGVAAFAARPERAGWLALGGIWNAQSVPGSQQGWFGLAADIGVAALAAAGAFLLRRTLRQDRVLGLLLLLGLVAVALVGVSATGAAQKALGEAMSQVPALGILRDGQKWSALAWPGYALALAAAAGVGPGGFRWGALRPWLLAAAVLGAVPDALWGGGGKLAPVQYPKAWSEVRDAVAEEPGRGAVLTVPVGMTRQYAWAGGRTSIDPAPRLLPVPVAQSGDLVVDGRTVPGEGVLARRAAADLLAGAGPERFAANAVGWVLVERDQAGALPAPAQAALNRFEPVRSGEGFELYRNPAVPWPVPAVAEAQRQAVLFAHLAWAGLLAFGAAGALWRGGRARRERPGPASSGAGVSDPPGRMEV